MQVITPDFRQWDDLYITEELPVPTHLGEFVVNIPDYNANLEGLALQVEELMRQLFEMQKFFTTKSSLDQSPNIVAQTIGSFVKDVLGMHVLVEKVTLSLGPLRWQDYRVSINPRRILGKKFQSATLSEIKAKIQSLYEKVKAKHGPLEPCFSAVINNLYFAINIISDLERRADRFQKFVE